MQKIILLALLLSSSFVNAQHSADNAIILNNISFDSSVQKLRDMGYHIQASDSIKKVCITEPSVSSLIMTLKVSKKNELYITGKYTTKYISSGDYGYLDVLYFKHGVQRPYWEEMMKFAGTFSDISYGRR